MPSTESSLSGGQDSSWRGRLSTLIAKELSGFQWRHGSVLAVDLEALRRSFGGKNSVKNQQKSLRIVNET